MVDGSGSGLDRTTAMLCCAGRAFQDMQSADAKSRFEDMRGHLECWGPDKSKKNGMICRPGVLAKVEVKFRFFA